jgi:hypothetical protein
MKKVNSRENRLPDPRQDPIEIIFWCLQTEDENVVCNGRLPGYVQKIVIDTKSEG